MWCFFLTERTLLGTIEAKIHRKEEESLKKAIGKYSALRVSVTALCASLICLCSWIALPIGGVPMTLQVFGVAFCGFLLGARGGASATALYLALGAVGLPVFAGFGASLAFLVGPTGGFLVGFLPLAFLCGIGARRKTMLAALTLAWTGLALCHIGGILWFAHVSAVSPTQAFLLSSLPYIIKDILFVALACVTATKIKKRIRGSSFFKTEESA